MAEVFTVATLRLQRAFQSDNGRVNRAAASDLPLQNRPATAASRSTHCYPASLDVRRSALIAACTIACFQLSGCLAIFSRSKYASQRPAKLRGEGWDSEPISRMAPTAYPTSVLPEPKDGTQKGEGFRNSCSIFPAQRRVEVKEDAAERLYRITSHVLLRLYLGFVMRRLEK